MDKEEIKKLALEYLKKEKEEDFKKEVQQALIEEDYSDLQDRFYTSLEFGTGGIRGIMGGGYNRLNPYMIQKATEGYASYLEKHGDRNKDGNLSVALAYDCRHNSVFFAKKAVEVFSAHNIKCYLFTSLRPTPELSFAIRELNCSGGVVFTASHNPKKYNGYKAYWSDGSQVIPPHDKGIIECVDNVDEIKTMDLKEAEKNGLLVYIDKEIDDKFVEMSKSFSINTELLKEKGKDLKVVFTPLHGTSAMLNERVTKEMGINLIIVPEQKEGDGDFPTVISPNPEDASALDMAIALAKKENADIVIATDPDGDRIGIAVNDGNNEFQLLTGNRHGVLLVDYVFSQLKNKNKLPSNPVFINTIVTTELQNIIAESYGAKTYRVLTGFKWVTKVIKEHEKDNNWNFVMGDEESYGFLIGTQLRDKDSVTATLLTIEMILYYKQENKNLLNVLDDIWQKHGYYEEASISKNFEGKEGIEFISHIMNNLRESPFTNLADEKVIKITDVKKDTILNLNTNKTTKLGLPSSNVLQFTLESGSIVSARPSGTEPKIKFYASVFSKNEDLNKAKQEVSLKIEKLSSDIEDYINELKNKRG